MTAMTVEELRSTALKLIKLMGWMRCFIGTMLISSVPRN